MIYSISGELVHVENTLAVIEANGIGYACKTTMNTLSKIGTTGQSVKLYTYLYVREDAVELFGFSTLAEKDCFLLLISVSGVGPKAALSILSDITPEGFALCVATEDYKTLTKSQGIGTKTAQRIVLELKDKVAKNDMIEIPAGSNIEVSAPKGSNASEAVNALMVLGYSKADAAKAVSALASDTPVEEMIKYGLKNLAGNL